MSWLIHEDMAGCLSFSFGQAGSTVDVVVARHTSRADSWQVGLRRVMMFEWRTLRDSFLELDCLKYARVADFLHLPKSFNLRW